MKYMVKALWFISLAMLPGIASALIVPEDILPSSTGSIVLGEWNKNFDHGREIADSQNIPMVVFYGGLSCGACESLQKACLTEEFLTWQAKKKIVFIFTKDNTRGDAAGFAKPTIGEKGFPYIAIYWNRDGKKPAKNSDYYIAFAGRDGNMPAKGGTLASQLIRSIDSIAGAYPYAGGEFAVPGSGSDYARLELEEGYAAGRRVVVPLVRTAMDDVYENSLECGESSVKLVWSAGETEKYPEVEVPGGVAAGGSIELRLKDSGGTVHATSTIAVVPVQPLSELNPKWIGEPFEYGEWTMDYDAAKAKGGYVLAMFSGVLWCPYCYGMGNSLLNSADFTAWARDNNVSLVLFDQSKASTPATAQGSGLARLLSYAIGTTSIPGRPEACGAGYMTRKGISKDEAKPVIDRVTKFTKEWLAPDSTAARLGNPTLLLVKDDKVVARFSSYRNADKVYDPQENIARLNDLLKLADGVGEGDKYAQTTKLEVVLGTAAQATLQVNQSVQRFKLSSPLSGRVDFVATGASEDNPAILAVERMVDGRTTTLASGTNAVSCVLSGEDGLYLGVSSFKQSRMYGPDTAFNVDITSSVVLLPSEKSAAFADAGAPVSIEVEKDVTYRLDGFGLLDPSVFEDCGVAEDGGRYFKALKGGVFSVPVAGETLVYQTWNPGEVAFDMPELMIFDFQRTGTVYLTRSKGSSGAVEARVRVSGGAAVNGERYLWDDETKVSWADGESGTVAIPFSLLETGRVEPDQTFVLGVSVVAGHATVGESSTEAVTISDLDTPVLEKREYDADLTATFLAAGDFQPLKVFNVNGGKVSFKKVSGKLPKGVKLAYEGGNVVLVGAPKNPGVYTYVFRIEERTGKMTATGPEITLTFSVAAAGDVAKGGNALLDSSFKATLPVFCDRDGVREPAGTVELSNSPKNKLKAKFWGMSKKPVSLSGYWSSIEGGTAYAELAGKGMSIGIALSPEGFIETEIRSDGSSEVFESVLPLKVGKGQYAAAFTGRYTVGLVETDATDSAGWGYVLVNSVDSSGKAKWSAVLPNGASLSGTSCLTVDAAGHAVLPVFRYKSKDYLFAVLMLKANAADAVYPRAVRECDGAPAVWGHVAKPASQHKCIARGSWYRSGEGIGDCCKAQFGDVPMLLSARVGDWASFRYGDVISTASGAVDILDGKLSLVERSKQLKLSLSKKKGVISGSMGIVFDGNNKVKAKFKGVLIPGWHDCGCELPDPSDPFRIDVSLPFAVGAAWISDIQDGVAIKRGFPVVIDESEE